MGLKCFGLQFDCNRTLFDYFGNFWELLKSFRLFRKLLESFPFASYCLLSLLSFFKFFSCLARQITKKAFKIFNLMQTRSKFDEFSTIDPEMRETLTETWRSTMFNVHTIRWHLKISNSNLFSLQKLERCTTWKWLSPQKNIIYEVHEQIIRTLVILASTTGAVIIHCICLSVVVF